MIVGKNLLFVGRGGFFYARKGTTSTATRGEIAPPAPCGDGKVSEIREKCRKNATMPETAARINQIWTKRKRKCYKLCFVNVKIVCRRIENISVKRSKFSKILE